MALLCPLCPSWVPRLRWLAQPCARLLQLPGPYKDGGLEEFREINDTRYCRRRTRSIKREITARHSATVWGSSGRASVKD